MEPYLPKLLSALKMFKSDLDKVDSIYTLDELSELEKRCVMGLREIALLSNKLNYDLYNIVSVRRQGLNNGTITEKQEPAKETKPVAKKRVARKKK